MGRRLREGHFDANRVWPARREIDEACACSIDLCANTQLLVAIQIVRDDTVAGRQLRDKNLFDAGLAPNAVDGSLEHHWGPMPVRRNAQLHVVAFQCAWGMLARGRIPCAARPGRRVILVDV